EQDAGVAADLVMGRQQVDTVREEEQGHDAEDQRDPLHVRPHSPGRVFGRATAPAAAPAGSVNGSAAGLARLAPSEGTTDTAMREARGAPTAASMPLNRALDQVSFHICSHV